MYEKFLEQYNELIFVSDRLEQADVIFIPGNALPDMAERAAEIWRAGYAPYILPSGKHSILKERFDGPRKKKDVYRKKYQTEWEFLQDVLVSNGVKEEVVLREDQATYTYENALFSKKVLEQKKIKVKKAIICCQAFHARRCKMYYQLVFPEVELFICPVDTGINRQNWFRSSLGIEIVLGEVKRCGEQFEDILKKISCQP